MNFKDALNGSTLKAGDLYIYSIPFLGKYIWEYKKEKQIQQDDKHQIVFRNTAKMHQHRLQTYHDLISNKKKQYSYLFTSQYWTNNLIVRNINDDPILPRG